MRQAKRARALGVLAAVVLASGAASAATSKGAPLRIDDFLPQGRVSGVEAVQLRFASPAVAFGDPSAAAPVELNCEGPVPPGKGRWLDDTRWTYVFERTVPAGVRCTATPNLQFRSPDGASLRGGLTYEFNTGAPTITDVRPYVGQDIDEEQIFILQFDAPVDQQAVAAKSHCAVEGVGERIPVHVVANEHRDNLLKASYLQEPEDPSTLALLQCGRALPTESVVRLRVGPDIRAVDQPASLPGSERVRELKYEVRAPFTAKISCTRERAGKPCLPIAPISLTFSAPVPSDTLAGLRLSAGDTVYEQEPREDEDGFVTFVSYPGPFPAGATLTLTLPNDLRDDAGRALLNAERFPMAIEVSDYPPLAKFASGAFGVIERFAHARPGATPAEPAAVPVTLRNIEPDPTVRGVGWSAGQVADLHLVDDIEVLRWYARLQRLNSGRWTEAQLRDITEGRAPRHDYGSDAPRVDARAFSLLASQASARRLALPGAEGSEPRPFEVVGVPVQEPGFHVLELESPRLGASLLEDSGNMYVRTGVLLTNLSLHVKQGRDDLLVWVTSLADATSIADAEIQVRDCSGKPLLEGRTDARGIWHHLGAVESPLYCAETGLEGLFVSARISADHPQAHGQADYAFALSGWDRGIETWRFNVPTSSDSAPEILTHTVYDRSLFRAGETVSMKHYLREEVREGLKVPVASRPDRVVIEHEGSSQQHELPIAWQETPSGGVIALSEFEIPESARLGSYAVRLTDAKQGWYGSTRFRVEEFRLPVLSGKLAVRGGEQPDILVAPAMLDVDMQLSWMSGGPAAGQKVMLNAVASDRAVRFADYDDYSFLPPPAPKEEAAAEGVEPGDESAGLRRQLFVDGKQFELNADGVGSVQIDQLPQTDRPQRYLLEANFADPSGEIQTLSQSVDVWPSAIQAGLKTEGWDRADRDIPVKLLALGTDAQPRGEVAMKLLAVERKTYTVRKRMVGGFYRYDSHTERTELGTLCEGRTAETGTLDCTVRFDRPGAYELIAVAQDEQGRPSRAYTTLWVSGSGELWFGGDDDDRIDLIPARRDWVAGEEAEFQVRMPFREAVALVTVEREGVLWAEQVKLTGRNPLVKVPVSAEWGPNAYVSVLVLRGRLYELPWQSFFQWGWKRPGEWLEAYRANQQDALVTSTIDLAKPSFRYGLTEIRVGGNADRLQVAVTPQRDVLQVGEEVSVRLKVSLPDGSPAANGTVAFSAVDEALLELAPNDSWALYEAMHPRRSLAVRTATSQMEVVGRRHYGRKAVAAGGGGGAVPTRQLFDTLLSWQPLVQLDGNGEANVRVRLNDSLSRFRLVAVADHGSAYFGTASASIVSRQDLQLASGLPPVVREGDAYLASVTLRNGTEEARELEVAAYVESAEGETKLDVRRQHLGPHGSATVSWKVTVPMLAWPAESGTLKWRFEAGDGSIADKVAVSQRVEPRTPTTTVQATLLGLEAGGAVDIPVETPTAALRGAEGIPYGGIAIDASASLLGGLEGVREWWERYPYTCLEQTASQAIALEDAQRWQRIVDRLPVHMDDDGLLRYFPGTGPGSDVLTAYLLSVSDAAQRLGLRFELPLQIKDRMLEGLQAFAEGRLQRGLRLSDTALDSRRIMAMEALARYGRVNRHMLTNFSQDPDKWPTPTVVDWLSILANVPDYPAREQAMVQARRLLVSRMSVSGATMAFSEASLNAAPGLMATRTTALARLMITVMERPEWQADLPRMAQGLIQAQTGGAWSITTDNLLGVLALRSFSRQFEPIPATGRVTAGFPSAQEVTIAMPPKGETGEAKLDWPQPAAPLQLRHEGEGRAWVGLRAQLRMPLTEPESAGYTVQRRVIPVQQSKAGEWSRGDVYRVELNIQARDGATWVAVSDPVPAGATILGSGLGRDAQPAQAAQATQAAKQDDAFDAYPPVFVERGSTTYRAYFDYLPAGQVRVAYTVRLNTVGHFALPPTRIEALYRPDIHGSFPNHEGIDVGPGPFDTAAQ